MSASLDKNFEDFSIFKGFDESWRKRIQNNRHLAVYLTNLVKNMVKLRVFKPPQLVQQPTRDMAAIKQPNIIYPVGDPVYIHIYPDPKMGSIKYHPIEPRLVKYRDAILNEVEKVLALNIDEKNAPENIKEREKILYRLLSKLFPKGKTIKISIPKETVTKSSTQKKKSTKSSTLNIVISQDLYERLRYEIYCEKIGLSILEPMIRDPFIEDVHCSGKGPIFIHHKIFGAIETTITFNSSDELDNFIIKLSEFTGKPVSHRSPIVDATLPDGSRINIVFGEDISQRGSNFTIRKFASKPISITELIKFGTFNPLMAAYVWMLLEERMSVWISGETASGKTTTLSAITPFIPSSAKIVSIEEVPEVHIPHNNWIREVVRETGDAAAENAEAVSMFQLLKAALRQRPTYIIVGEIRGREGAIAFQAMQTGHPVLTTFHADSVTKLVQRLTGHPINIPKTYIDNLNAVIIQSAVHDPETGKYKRRVLSVNEVLGYDPVEMQFNFIEVFSWEPSKDIYEFRGVGSSYLLETKIAAMKGISGYEIKKIYEELELRAKILDFMVKLEIFDYYEVWQNLTWIYNVGLEQAYHKYRKMCMFKLGPHVVTEKASLLKV